MNDLGFRENQLYTDTEENGPLERAVLLRDRILSACARASAFQRRDRGNTRFTAIQELERLIAEHDAMYIEPGAYAKYCSIHDRLPTNALDIIEDFYQSKLKSALDDLAPEERAAARDKLGPGERAAELRSRITDAQQHKERALQHLEYHQHAVSRFLKRATLEDAKFIEEQMDSLIVCFIEAKMASDELDKIQDQYRRAFRPS